jgi:group I intron endonuclease
MHSRTGINNPGIYIIKSKIKPERCYIGSSINVDKRWYDHRRKLLYNRHHSRKLQRHCNKYGVDDLIFEVLSPCPICDLVRTEQFYIDMYNPYFNCSPTAYSNIGVKHTAQSRANMSKGQKGKVIPEEVRRKISESTKGRRVSDDVRRNMSAAQKGHKNCLGRVLSEETKRKISESLKGHPVSDEARLKMRRRHLGKRASDKTKAKLRALNVGKKLSPEHREKISKALKARYA